MEPGDMVLYESHSVIYGHPFPLKDCFFDNIFIHFEPDYEDDNRELPLNILEEPSEAETWQRRAAAEARI
jgi:hypothetical protein